MTRTAVVDVDALIYAIGFVGEERSIKAVHKISGREFESKNRTEFWGRSKKTIGGQLLEINKSRIALKEEPFVREDFDIYDIQKVTEPLKNVLHSAKLMYQGRVELSKADKHYGYIGGKENFRVERSTILKYKGNREDVLRPLLKDEIVEYYVKHLGVIQLDKPWETDDQCVMDCYADNNKFIVGVDKDYYGCPVSYLNANKPDDGIINGNCFGALWLDEKGDVRGYGRLFFYWQVACGDSSDWYFANSASDVKWADKSAFNALKDATNDLEALQALKNVYVTLYPSTKEIIGWRGDTIEIDAMYVLNENWDLARMLRYEGDEVVATDVLKKFNLL